MAGAATAIGFLPLTWLAARNERRAQWWWIAVAFGVSGLADLLSYGPHPLLDPWLAATVYPVSQAGILVLALGERREAPAFIGLLVLAGFVAVFWEGIAGPSLFLETIAAGIIVRIAWHVPEKRLRALLLYAFGIGWLAWVGYTLNPGWLSWGLYQSVRAVSLGMFCWANLYQQPIFRFGQAR